MQLIQSFRARNDKEISEYRGTNQYLFGDINQHRQVNPLGLRHPDQDSQRCQRALHQAESL